MIDRQAYLGLYLDAPLQSWGYQSRFDRRTTLAYPSRSAIVGMLCAAMGVERGDRDGIARVDGVAITVLVFDVSGRMVDYHTVLDTKRADGSENKDAVLTFREYLEGAKFGVVLGGDRMLLEEVRRALADPVWGVWLGRKSCIAAAPICTGALWNSQEEAEAMLRERADGRDVKRRVVEAGLDEGADMICDRPLDFAARTFGPRRTKVEDCGHASFREASP